MSIKYSRNCCRLVIFLVIIVSLFFYTFLTSQVPLSIVITTIIEEFIMYSVFRSVLYSASSKRTCWI